VKTYRVTNTGWESKYSMSASLGGMNKSTATFWSIAATEMLQQLQTTAQGLTTDEARARLTRYRANLLKPKMKSDAPTLLVSQFKSPIILILFIATGVSFFLGDPVDAFIIHIEW
jgi:Mg2+-importing ATPase